MDLLQDKESHVDQLNMYTTKWPPPGNASHGVTGLYAGYQGRHT